MSTSRLRFIFYHARGVNIDVGVMALPRALSILMYVLPYCVRTDTSHTTPLGSPCPLSTTRVTRLRVAWQNILTNYFKNILTILLWRVVCFSRFRIPRKSHYPAQPMVRVMLSRMCPVLPLRKKLLKTQPSFYYYILLFLTLHVLMTIH